MMHTIQDEIYDINKAARGVEPDSYLDKLYLQNKQDIDFINKTLLAYAKKHAPVENYIFTKDEIEDLEIMNLVKSDFRTMHKTHQARIARLLTFDILAYYERLNIFCHFDEEKFTITFDLPY